MSNKVNMVKKKISNVKNMKCSIDIKNAHNEKETKFVNMPRLPNHIF